MFLVRPPAFLPLPQQEQVVTVPSVWAPKQDNQARAALATQSTVVPPANLQRHEPE